MTSPKKAGIVAGLAVAGAMYAGLAAKTEWEKGEHPYETDRIGGLVTDTGTKAMDIVAPRASESSGVAEAVAERYVAGAHALLSAAETRLEGAGREKTCANLTETERMELSKLSSDAYRDVMTACGPAIFAYNGNVSVTPIDAMSISDLKARISTVRAQYVEGPLKNGSMMPLATAHLASAIASALLGLVVAIFVRRTYKEEGGAGRPATA